MDRDDTLRRAEKLLRQGRLDAAIAEYAKVAEEQPKDWTTAMVLGDLYVRAGRIEDGVRQYARIADHLAREGFISKATALYKKIVKIHPDDDAALRRAAELAAQQGLTADAREHLQALFNQRLRRDDRAGAAEAAAAHADLDPNDPAGRVESARMLAELGDTAGAAAQLRAAGHVLHDAGKTAEGIDAWRQALRVSAADVVTSGLLVQTLLDQGDPDGAREVARSAADWRNIANGLTRVGRNAEACDTLDQAIRADPTDVAARVHLARAAMAHHDDARARDALAPVAASAEPMVQFALTEIEFRSGEIERGRTALQRCLASRDDLVEPAIGLGCALGPEAPESGFAVIATVVHRAEAGGDTDRALDALERFLAVAPDHVAALEELIRVCGHGFYENQQYRAQIQLADLYLARGQWREARALAEHLISARPDDQGHVRRLTCALTGLGLPNVEAAVREHVLRVTSPEGLSDFAAAVPPPSPLAEDFSSADVAAPPALWRASVPGAPPAGILVPPASTPDSPPAPDARAGPPVSLDGGVPASSRGGRPEPAPDRDVFEIDLSGELDDLLGAASAASAPAPAGTDPLAPPDPAGLDGFFHGLREERGRDMEGLSAAMAYDQASEHFNRGDIDAATACLRSAARDPLYRFRAASMLARFARDEHRMSEAVEWLERAAESPAPTTEASNGLLYELGDILAASGEDARALAVFLELQSLVPDYRDVRARIEHLSTRQAGRPDPRKGTA